MQYPHDAFGVVARARSKGVGRNSCSSTNSRGIEELNDQRGERFVCVTY